MLVVYANSIDCSDIVNLAIGLKMNSQQATIMGQLYANCCSAYGVTCSGTRVTSLSWQALNLNGFLNETALPDSLILLALDGNPITGNFPSKYPSSLLYLVGLGRTMMNCVLPTSWPIGILEIDINGNLCTGDVSVFPRTLTRLYLGYNLDQQSRLNRFTGSLSLNQPKDINIQRNWVSDVIFQDTSLLTNCNISNNPLLGNTNVFALSMCDTSNLFAYFSSKVSYSVSKVSFFDAKVSYSFSKEPTSTTYANFAGTNLIKTITYPITVEDVLTIGIKWMIEILLLFYVLLKTPFKRELLKIRDKAAVGESQNRENL